MKLREGFRNASKTTKVVAGIIVATLGAVASILSIVAFIKSNDAQTNLRAKSQDRRPPKALSTLLRLMMARSYISTSSAFTRKKGAAHRTKTLLARIQSSKYILVAAAN